MESLNWHDQAEVWLLDSYAFDTEQGKSQKWFNAASVAFDGGFLFIRPRNDRKTYSVPAAGVLRVELPPTE